MDSSTLTLPNDILLGEAVRLIRSGHEIVLKTKGCSMLPFIIGDWDSVVLQDIRDSQDNWLPKKGDVVLAEIQPGQYVLHRYVRSYDRQGIEMAHLMGDGNLNGGEDCPIGRIQARAVAIVRPDGKRRRVPKAKCWAALKPARRWLLAIYRRSLLKIRIRHYQKYEN